MVQIRSTGFFFIVSGLHAYSVSVSAGRAFQLIFFKIKISYFRPRGLSREYLLPLYSRQDTWNCGAE